MKQSRLRMRFETLDVILDNTLLPAVYALALAAYLWVKFQ